MAKSEFRLVLTWLALIVLTLLSFVVSEYSHLDINPLRAVVIVSALIKVRFVILDFMEARCGPWALRLILEGWTIVLGAVLLIA